MTDRDVTARLRVEMGQYERDMDRASKVTETFGKTAEKAAEQVEKAQKRQSDAAGNLRLAEQRLEELRSKGTASTSQMMAAEQRVTNARQESAAAALGAAQAEESLDQANRDTATTGGRLATVARENSEAWNAAGVSLLAAGGAVTGLGLAALKTGIEYNTLQQTSRAALTSLLGSTSAAADQMDRLDEFARTSPFSKATFITAQQQMLAFGIEARKVVPYLDAIQNAVAASGGSNDDIAGIAATMSKIQSSAKITAEDLNELGNRGVNAAELIGSQMGMTGAEIRQAITSGSLDAEQALDALAAGMSERFDGAADNVKNTFAGAMDRVVAAWRDMSSALAEPFVGKNGGGLFTGLLNETADVMRSIEALPGPIQGGVAALGLLGGAAALAGGSYMLLLPRIAETKLQLELLQQTSPGAANALGKLGTAARVAGIAMVALAAVKIADGLLSTDSVAGVEEFTAAILDLSEGAVSSRDSLDKLFKADKSWGLGGLSGDLEGVSDAIKEIDRLDGSGLARIDSFMSGIIGESKGDKAKARIEQLDAALAKLVTEGNIDEAAAGFKEYAAAAEEAGVSTAAARGYLPGYAAALKETENQQRITTSSSEDLTAEIKSQTEAWQQNATAAMGQRGAAIAAQESLTAARDLVAEGTQVLRDNTGAIDANAESTIAADSALIDLAGAYLANYDAMVANGAQSAALDGALATQRQSFIDTAIQMGYTAEEAIALADQYGQIPRSVPTEVTLSKASNYDAIYNGLIFNLDNLSKPRTATINIRAGAIAGGLAGVGAPALAGLLLQQSRGAVVDYFAEGGFKENHVAQFAPAGSWRVFGEPETGGEAYIPLSPAKWARSREIWKETGKRLGMGDDNAWSQSFQSAAGAYSYTGAAGAAPSSGGGGAMSSSSTYAPTVQVSVVALPGQNPDTVGNKVGNAVLWAMS